MYPYSASAQGSVKDPPDAQVHRRQQCRQERRRSVEQLGIRHRHEPEQHEGIHDEEQRFLGCAEPLHIELLPPQEGRDRERRADGEPEPRLGVAAHVGERDGEQDPREQQHPDSRLRPGAPSRDVQGEQRAGGEEPAAERTG